MEFLNDKALVKKIKLGAIALAVLAVIAVIIIKKDSIIPGWHTDGEDKYYLSFPLKRASGIVNIDGNDYFFSTHGDHELLYGFNKLDDYYYYSDENGVIVKGETVIDGQPYYFDASTGKLHKNCTEIIGGKLWYFDNYGFKVFGIVELDGQKFCFNEAGNLKKGLQIIDGKTYYFDPETEWMIYGLKTVDGATYYFGEDGAAVTGTVTLNGTEYTFGEDGKQIK